MLLMFAYHDPGTSSSSVPIRRSRFLLAAKSLAISLLLLTLTGCSLSGGPRMRLGCLPTATFGVPFPDPDNLGQHAYGFGLSESGGIVYTCKGGHIDIDHVRGSADATRYLVRRVRETLLSGREQFTFHLTGETSRHTIMFTYPPNWDKEPDKERIVGEVSMAAGPYLAMNATIWHEIMTWFGVHFGGFEPEFNSAFSWEDTYSNLIGTRLAVEAMRDTGQDFDDAMTMGIQRQLRELGVQPKSTAIHASDKVRGTWYTGNLVPDLKMRNFDIGLDGSITPTLVPDIEGCSDAPLTLPSPNLDTLSRHGFTLSHHIRPRVFEQGAIFRAAGSDKLLAETHFPILLKYMKLDAAKRGYMYDE
jgi:hypothetical protein